MSFWLEDADGKYLGDIATNVGIVRLREAHIGPLDALLDAGTADSELLRQIVAEARRTPATAYIADLLDGAKAPVYVTDGCGHADEVENELRPTLADNLSRILNSRKET